jgi:signal transduction histidine kinase
MTKKGDGDSRLMIVSGGNLRVLPTTRQRQNSPFETTSRRDHADSLQTGLIEAGTVIDFLPSPAALWSLDRHLCVFNDAARELFGFCEHDFNEDRSLWLERIHPDDRKEFLRAWKSLQGGETRVASRYRFQPKNQTQGVWLREVSLLYGRGVPEKSDVWTVYTEEVALENVFRGAGQARNFVRGLTHEMGNNLQAIRGEVDILRFSHGMPNDSADTIYRGINQVRRLVQEINEYLFPSSLESRTEDPASVLSEVIQSREKEMAAHGIRTGMKLKESLPKVPLDSQFGRALTDLIDFSRALLSKGGELNIEAGVCRQDGENYIELNIVSSSETSLQVEEGDVFRPFANVNGHRAGLSMAVAQQILKRHFGKIAFRKEESNRGVFSLLIRVPNTPVPG